MTESYYIPVSFLGGDIKRYLFSALMLASIVSRFSVSLIKGVIKGDKGVGLVERES